MQSAFGHGHEYGGVLPCGARGVDALVGHAFGEVQFVEAILAHRGIAFAPVEPALVDLRDAGEQDSCGPAILSDQGLEFVQQGVVAEVGNCERVHGRVSSGGWS
jgi:hypothetical protein